MFTKLRFGTCSNNLGTAGYNLRTIWETADCNSTVIQSNTSFVLQELIRARIHISSSAVGRRLLEAGRKAKKPSKSSFLLKK